MDMRFVISIIVPTRKKARTQLVLRKVSWTHRYIITCGLMVWPEYGKKNTPS